MTKVKTWSRRTRPAERSDMDKPHLHDTEQMVAARAAQWALQSVIRTMAVVMLGLGVAILLGGPQRFAGLSYSFALDTPGAPWSWGALSFIAGSVLLLGTFVEDNRLVALGGFACGFWCLFFGITFARAAAAYEQANTTAMVSYCGFAIVFFVVAGAHLAMSPIRFRKGPA